MSVKMYKVEAGVTSPTPEQSAWIRKRWVKLDIGDDLWWYAFDCEGLSCGYRKRVPVACISAFGDEWYYHMPDAEWMGKGSTIEEAAHKAEHGIHCYLLGRLELNKDNTTLQVEEFLHNAKRA